jgi:hypothetical protein
MVSRQALNNASSCSVMDIFRVRAFMKVGNEAFLDINMAQCSGWRMCIPTYKWPVIVLKSDVLFEHSIQSSSPASITSRPSVVRSRADPLSLRFIIPAIMFKSPSILVSR